MRVEAHFNAQGLELVLTAESDAEKRMVGAVLNQPQVDRQTEILSEMLMAQIRYDGHFTNKSISSVTLRVFRNNADGLK